MITFGEGTVMSVIRRRPGAAEITVRLAGNVEKAVNYDCLTGPAAPGDEVVLNTTAVRLGLGTGGYHFVALNYSRGARDILSPGHIVKMRYTPCQAAFLSCEEEDGNRAVLNDFTSLDNRPVIIAGLHSMLSPAALALKSLDDSLKIAYVMTDTAALPLSFSRDVSALCRRKTLHVTISCGQAFGGELEAVNVYSGLAAAFAISGAHVAIVAPGPGIAGTSSRLGFTAMEVGDNVNRAGAMGGCPVVVPRLGFADGRSRHRGISHHTLTALALAALHPAWLPLPPLDIYEKKIVMEQLQRREIFEKHRVCSVPVKKDEVISLIMSFLQDKKNCPEAVPGMTTMGRGPAEDPHFFMGVYAAAALAASFARRQ